MARKFSVLDSLSLLGSLANPKDAEEKKVPIIANKVKNMYGTTTPKNTTDSSVTNSKVTLNPFLKKDGSLVNKHINYQQVLDNPKVGQKAKQFISQATGLTPSVTTASVTPSSEYQGTVSATGNNIADSAQKYLGTPYVWGGESMSEGGFDCSGFVYNALKDAGYKVGRTTAQGYRSQGIVVNKADMQPGDLLFFGRNGNASHIGIYLGNGQMIHSSGGSRNTASNPGKGVTINNVDYRSDFIEARRY